MSERATRSMGRRAAAAQDERLRRDVVGAEGALEEGLEAGHEDARPAIGATPGGERGHPGRRFVADELGAFVGQRGARLEGHDARGVAQPGAQLLGDAVADLGIAGDPDETLAGGLGERRREVRLGAVGHGRERDVPEVTPDATGGRQSRIGRRGRGARR